MSIRICVYILFCIILTGCLSRFNGTISLKNNLTNSVIKRVQFRSTYSDITNVGDVDPGKTSPSVTFSLQPIIHFANGDPWVDFFVDGKEIGRFSFESSRPVQIISANHKRTITITSNIGTGSVIVTTNDIVSYDSSY